jgi:hypothetical protein
MAWVASVRSRTKARPRINFPTSLVVLSLREREDISRSERTTETILRALFPSSAWERTFMKLCFTEGEAELREPDVPKQSLGTRL